MKQARCGDGVDIVANRTKVAGGPGVAGPGKEKAGAGAVEAAVAIPSETQKLEVPIFVARKLPGNSLNEDFPLFFGEMKEVHRTISVVIVKRAAAGGHVHDAGSRVSHGAEGERKCDLFATVKSLVSPAKLKPISGELGGQFREFALEGLAGKDQAGVMPM